MRKTTILLLLLLFPFLASAQLAVINKSLRMIENSSADVQYNNEFGYFRNSDLDNPFPFVVIKIELEGDVSQAKSMLSLDLGSMFKVEAKDIRKDNQILFLISAHVRSIYLLCGDGCKPQQLHYGALRSNKVYTCRVSYVAKLEQSVSGDGDLEEMKRQIEEMRKQNDFLRQMLQSKQQTQQLKQDYEKMDRVRMEVNGVSFYMRWVERGDFYMGSDERSANEQPKHLVSLSGYYIGETEVTQALWMAVMDTNPSHNIGNDLPVESVSWDDCQEFVRKLSELTGRKFSLPTEAQWEYAAHGGKRGNYFKFSGSSNVKDLAWYSDNSLGLTHLVATKQPNELGLFDMTGNVLEWCQDWYGYYSRSDQIDPVGLSDGSLHIMRGGGFSSSYEQCIITVRNGGEGGSFYVNCGLRLAMQDESDVLEFDVNGVSFNMRKVEGGEFTMMQNRESSAGRYGKSLVLDSYYMAETEVTQGLWKAVMGTNPSHNVGDNLPVESVSWNDCQEFIKRLNELTGRVFSLPTEAQWEYAARGGKCSKRYKFAGGDFMEDVAWCADNSGGVTHDVAGRMRNELGLFDMSGNVWEWCMDWDVDGRVLRGGCFINNSQYCSLKGRGKNESDKGSEKIGMRLALSDMSGAMEVKVKGVSFNMRMVKGGSFDMVEDKEARQKVSLTDYYIGETEVTQALWRAVMDTNPSHNVGDDLPVESVSWDDCQEFVNRLSQLTGLQFSLPTEAQWEFAASGGVLSQKYVYAGSDCIDDVAWYEGNDSSTTHRVAEKWPNELGLYDMSGNVSEWCLDFYGVYSMSGLKNPAGPESGYYRVLRGGSFSNNSANCRTDNRNRIVPYKKFDNVGLRIVISIP